MEVQSAAGLCRDGLILVLELSLPLLLAGLLAGLVVGLAQAVTQVQDSAMSGVVRLVVMAATAVVFLPWMLSRLVEYSEHLWENIPETIRPWL